MQKRTRTQVSALILAALTGVAMTLFQNFTDGPAAERGPEERIVYPLPTNFPARSVQTKAVQFGGGGDPNRTVDFACDPLDQRVVYLKLPESLSGERLIGSITHESGSPSVALDFVSDYDNVLGECENLHSYHPGRTKICFPEPPQGYPKFKMELHGPEGAIAINEFFLTSIYCEDDPNFFSVEVARDGVQP